MRVEASGFRVQGIRPWSAPGSADKRLYFFFGQICGFKVWDFVKDVEWYHKYSKTRVLPPLLLSSRGRAPVSEMHQLLPVHHQLLPVHRARCPRPPPLFPPKASPRGPSPLRHPAACMPLRTPPPGQPHSFERLATPRRPPLAARQAPPESEDLIAASVYETYSVSLSIQPYAVLQ